jgi:hypothetical protein
MYVNHKNLLEQPTIGVNPVTADLTCFILEEDKHSFEAYGASKRWVLD